MAQHQPGQHDNACRQQRRDDNQDQHTGFTRLHGAHLRFAARLAPRLERLHIVIKLLRHRDQLAFQQIVIAVRALLVQGFQHRADTLLVVHRQARGDVIQQLLPLLIRHAAADHALQRFLCQRHFLVNGFDRPGRIVQQADLHHADGLSRFVTRAQDQRIAGI